MRLFYSNLAHMYGRENYIVERIWNLDETSAQVDRNGGGQMWARKGSISIHKVLPNERKWITSLTCVNAANDCIPGFYVFCSKKLRANYVVYCEDRAVMAMQKRAWMIATLFSRWISHFIRYLESKGGISHERQDLLIFNDHNSQVILR